MWIVQAASMLAAVAVFMAGCFFLAVWMYARYGRLDNHFAALLLLWVWAWIGLASAAGAVIHKHSFSSVLPAMVADLAAVPIPALIVGFWAGHRLALRYNRDWLLPCIGLAVFAVVAIGMRMIAEQIPGTAWRIALLAGPP